ncbi:uncharacterized protein TNCV_1149401 [Trichonephila clavipes]|nr:uncharacterized protein TNCV_1149401 [Trichonephila clavipes]
MPLADGHKSEVEVYTTSVVIRLAERVIRTPLIALPYAKENQTLLGMDFLQKADIVLNLKHRNWFFNDTPRRTFDFVKEAIMQEVQSRPNLEENICLLREDEVKYLMPEQERNELVELLNFCMELCFNQGEILLPSSNGVSTLETIILFRCLPNILCTEILVHLLRLFLSIRHTSAKSNYTRDDSSSSPSLFDLDIPSSS